MPKVIGLVPPPPLNNAWPAVPATTGRLKLKVPAAAWGAIVTIPLVLPAREIVPLVPAKPRVGVAVIDGTPALFVFKIPPFAVAKP